MYGRYTMDLVFYNEQGEPIAYTENRIHIYLFNGECAAYIDEQSIYSFSGDHLGWFEDGWVRDHQGCAVFFTQEAKGGPRKPIKSVKPMKGMKLMKPMKGIKHMKPMKSTKSSSWSSLSGENFFTQ
jgi:hypothetical protein